MTCAEFKALAAEYALRTLAATERAACDAHLQASPTHEGCFEALREANEAVAAIGLSVAPIDPSPAVWAKLEKSLAPVVQPSRRRSTAWVAWAMSAALLLALVWVVRDRGTLVAQLDDSNRDRAADATARAQCKEALARSEADAQVRKDALELLTKTGTRLVALAPQGDATSGGNVILPADSQRGFFIGKGLTAPTGKDYELWLIRGDKKIAAGLLHGDHEGSLVAVIDPALLAGGKPDAVAVTLEPGGGGEQPRGPIVLVGVVGKI